MRSRSSPCAAKARLPHQVRLLLGRHFRRGLRGERRRCARLLKREVPHLLLEHAHLHAVVDLRNLLRPPLRNQLQLHLAQLARADIVEALERVLQDGRAGERGGSARNTNKPWSNKSM